MISPKLTSLVLGFAAAVSTVAVGAAEPITIKTIETLDKFEPFEAHLFHAGRLWVGRSRQDMAAYYRLDVYDAGGQAIATKTLTHSLRYIYPFGPNSVIVVGLGTDQLSHYSIATVSANGISVAPHTIPLGALADRFSGSSEAMIFSDPGGFDDPEHPTPPGQPLQTLFVYDGGEPRWLKPHIAEPEGGLIIDRTLYLLSSPGVASSAQTLHAIDLTKETDQLLLEHRQQLLAMIAVPGRNQLALSEAGANQVLLYDLSTHATQSWKISGGRPRALAMLGRCLLVGTEDTRQVQVFDLTATTLGEPLVTWDLSVAGPSFMGLRDLAADPQSGRIYARSAYACTPTGSCADARNSVIMGEPQADSLALRTCMSH